MYQEFMKKFIKMPALLVIAGALFFPFSFAHSAVFQVTESEGGRYGWNNENVELFFSVNNSYSDILEFAIGNNGAFHAGYSNDMTSPTAYLIEAAVVHKVDGIWRAATEEGWRELTWMNQASNFDSYTTAFLFTSKCEDCSEFSGFLELGFTDGYRGDALDPQSSFAAYSELEGVDNPIMGTTTVVPIPAAAWLFGSALLGLGALKRRKS